MSGSLSSKSCLTNTRIPRIELLGLIQTNLSPGIIASLLNVAEIGCFKRRNTWHGNRKYVYPHWKVCQKCGDLFHANTREQVLRNKTCSDMCKNAMIGSKNRGSTHLSKSDAAIEVECAVCGEAFWRYKCRVKRVKNPTCSHSCNGVLRGEEWKKHGHKGHANWSEESKSALVERMTGDTNPAWKGGVTYKARKGNYKREKMVRCPADLSEMARANGYIPEHRLVVARAMGRILTSSEVVHHMDHDNHNNDLANLALFKSNRDHKLYEHHGKPEPVWRGSSHAAMKE